MVAFLFGAVAWLYSWPGFAVLLVGAVLVCDAVDLSYYPRRVRTAAIAIAWPLWLAAALPFLLVLLLCDVHRYLRLLAGREAPARFAGHQLLDALNVPGWATYNLQQALLARRRYPVAFDRALDDERQAARSSDQATAGVTPAPR